MSLYRVVADLYGRLERLEAENARLRAAIAPTQENVKAVFEALAGNWSYAGGDAGRALAALRCIAERAGRT